MQKKKGDIISLAPVCQTDQRKEDGYNLDPEAGDWRKDGDRK